MNKVSKKKGLSMDEKVEKIERWFVAHPCPYTLKELIALIPKATGVIFQSVEECVEQLVSEDRVQQEKVGVHALFWRFPQTMTQQQQKAKSGGGTGGGPRSLTEARMSVKELEARAEALRDKVEQLQAAVQACTEEVGSDAQVEEDGRQLAALVATKVALLQDKKQLAAEDPAMAMTLQRSTAVALEAANRWTENFFLIEQHVTEKMGQSCRELRASLEVPQELDFIDEDVNEEKDDDDEEAAAATAQEEEDIGAITVEEALTDILKRGAASVTQAGKEAAAPSSPVLVPGDMDSILTALVEQKEVVSTESISSSQKAAAAHTNAEATPGMVLSKPRSCASRNVANQSSAAASNCDAGTASAENLTAVGSFAVGKNEKRTREVAEDMAAATACASPLRKVRRTATKNFEKKKRNEMKG